MALLLERLPNAFALTTTGLLIAIGVGMPLGFLAASRNGSWADSLLMMAAVCGVSIPNFWLGLMLLLLFSLEPAVSASVWCRFTPDVTQAIVP